MPALLVSAPKLQAIGGKSVQTSVLSLIDLAVSESALNSNERTSEGEYINISLLTLARPTHVTDFAIAYHPTRHAAPAPPKSFTTTSNLEMRRSSANLTETAPLNLGRKEGEGPSRGGVRVAFSGVDTLIEQGNAPDTHHRRASSPGAHSSRPSADAHRRQLSHNGHPRQASTASDTSSGSSFTTAVADSVALRVLNASEGRAGEGSEGRAEVKSGSHPTQPVVDPSSSNPFNASSTSLPPETARRLPTTPSRAAGTRAHQVEGDDGTNGRVPIRDATAACGVPPAQGPPPPDTPSARDPPPPYDAATANGPTSVCALSVIMETTEAISQRSSICLNVRVLLSRLRFRRVKFAHLPQRACLLCRQTCVVRALPFLLHLSDRLPSNLRACALPLPLPGHPASPPLALLLLVRLVCLPLVLPPPPLRVLLSLTIVGLNN
ncbi:hypothetical protein K525DRAFT_270043 [Schizophyllum commune Loenen D]|nr:hypothetical protein K525DRAFT_270043 [Schizophyllum commune Loenen D]